jgi:hypothetical protein
MVMVRRSAPPPSPKARSSPNSRVRSIAVRLVIAMIDSARERALRANSPEMLFLVDAWEAVFSVRLGDLDRARELLDKAERGLHDDTPVPR